MMMNECCAIDCSTLMWLKQQKRDFQVWHAERLGRSVVDDDHRR